MLKEIIEMSCPGDTLKDELEFRKIDFDEFEKKIELEEGELQLIFEGKKKIKKALAKKLEVELGIKFDFWLKLENNHIQDIKEEMRKLLMLYCKDNKGVIDLSELDFGDEVLKLEGIKAKVINNSNQQAVFIDNSNQLSDKISNFEQRSKNSINNIAQNAEKEINNNSQKSENISNSHQSAKYRIKNLKQTSLKIYNSEQISNGYIYNDEQNSKYVYNTWQKAKENINNEEQKASGFISNDNQTAKKVFN